MCLMGQEKNQNPELTDLVSVHTTGGPSTVKLAVSSTSCFTQEERLAGLWNDAYKHLFSGEA